MVARLDIEEQPGFGVGFGVKDIGDRAVDAIDRLWLACCDVDAAEADGDAQVDPCFPDRVAQIFELVIRIATRITDDNVSAAPADHLVDAEIFEMTAIRQIDVPAGVSRQPEHFIDDRDETEKRPLASRRSIVSRIPEPPAEPYIAEHHQKADQWR